MESAVGVSKPRASGLLTMRPGFARGCGKHLIIAIVSAIVSLDQNFSFLAGFAFVFGCLSLNQIAYVIGAVIIVFSEDPKASLTGDQADDFPGESVQSHDANGLSKHAPLARRADHKSG